jgi:hypothetical protein
MRGIIMKNASFLAVITIFILVMAQAAAELTDYQRGYADGLKDGLIVGKLQGQSTYSATVVSQYNSIVDNFNSNLVRIFGNNETIFSVYRLQPYSAGSVATTTPAIVHSIDGSWNQTSKEPPMPDAYGRIGEYPAEAYYTATGNWPNTTQNQAGNAGMGWV